MFKFLASLFASETPVEAPKVQRPRRALSRPVKSFSGDWGIKGTIPLAEALKSVSKGF